MVCGSVLNKKDRTMAGRAFDRKVAIEHARRIITEQGFDLADFKVQAFDSTEEDPAYVRVSHAPSSLEWDYFDEKGATWSDRFTDALKRGDYATKKKRK